MTSKKKSVIHRLSILNHLIFLCRNPRIFPVAGIPHMVSIFPKEMPFPDEFLRTELRFFEVSKLFIKTTVAPKGRSIGKYEITLIYSLKVVLLRS